MNPVLKIALELSKGNEIKMNRGDVVTSDFIKESPNSNLFNSLYFNLDGVEYRVSNHELPQRDYMQTHTWISHELAKKNGVNKLFHHDNIEVIVKNGEIFKLKQNFN